jgi:hypothetical protein
MGGGDAARGWAGIMSDIDRVLSAEEWVGIATPPNHSERDFIALLKSLGREAILTLLLTTPLQRRLGLPRLEPCKKEGNGEMVGGLVPALHYASTGLESPTKAVTVISSYYLPGQATKSSAHLEENYKYLRGEGGAVLVIGKAAELEALRGYQARTDKANPPLCIFDLPPAPVECDPRTWPLEIEIQDQSGLVPLSKDDAQAECAICLAPFWEQGFQKMGDKSSIAEYGGLVVEGACSHRFHGSCSSFIDGRNCPLCRRPWQYTGNLFATSGYLSTCLPEDQLRNIGIEFPTRGKVVVVVGEGRGDAYILELLSRLLKDRDPSASVEVGKDVEFPSPEAPNGLFVVVATSIATVRQPGSDYVVALDYPTRATRLRARESIFGVPLVFIDTGRERTPAE